MIPKKVFIVPYRDRESHKFVFLSCMKEILKEDYEIIFAHQSDKRKFNRGAMRNIGFMYAKDTYPDHWKDITFIFHDIDYISPGKIFSYDTRVGVVNHFYGFKQTLGGIWAIKGCDYYNLNGFPNIWGWGFEDNRIKLNWIKMGGKIDYSEFINYPDKRIVKLDCANDGHQTREINQYNLVFAKKLTKEMSGISTITDLIYTVEQDDNIKMLNITNFITKLKEQNGKYTFATSKAINQDLKNRTRRAVMHNAKKNPKRTTMGMGSIIPHKSMEIKLNFFNKYKKR